MPNESITEALAEVYALAPTQEVILDTIEVRHPSMEDSIYMVHDRRSWDLTLEDGVTVKTFEPVPFRFIPPSSTDEGARDMTIAIDNVDRRIFQFLKEIPKYGAPTEIYYRPYLSSDPTTVQSSAVPPLYLGDIQVTATQVTGRASLGDIVNKKYPSEFYEREQFPSLA